MNWSNEADPPQQGDLAQGESRGPKTMGDLQKTITMAQIAKAAGVSQGAISSLLNDRDYGIRVSEKTRERVFKVCREMGYIPNDLRAVVRMYPELGEYCLMISTSIAAGVGDPFVARLVRSAMASIGDSAHALTLAVFDAEKEYSGAPDELPVPIRSGIVSKFLFFGLPNQSLMQQVLRRGLPVISLGADVPLAGVANLLPDYASAAKAAIKHLGGLGHRHVGIVSGPFGANDPQIIELHHGVRMACEELGLQIEPQNIVYGDLTCRAGSAAAEELLSHPVKPTAVFCLTDAAAAGVLAHASSRGLRIPGDLSVIGCGDDPFSEVVQPQLTTIHIPAEEMARRAIGAIERIIQSPLAAEPTKELIPVRLIERGSTGPVIA